MILSRCMASAVFAVVALTGLFAQGQVALFDGAVKSGYHVGGIIPDNLNAEVPIADGIAGFEFREPFALRHYNQQGDPALWHELLYEINVRDASQKLKLVPGEEVIVDFRMTLLDSVWAPKENYCSWDWMSGDDPVIFECEPFDDDDPSKGRPGSWFTDHAFLEFDNPDMHAGFTLASFNYAYYDHPERNYTGILMNPFDADRLEGEPSNGIVVTDQTTDFVVTAIAKPCGYLQGTLVFEYVGPESGEAFIRLGVNAKEVTITSEVQLNWSEAQKVGIGAAIFYDDSVYDAVSDEDAIAPDKFPLFNNETAEFENYTSYSKGINGIVVDLWGLDRDATEDDFVFRVGNDNFPDQWKIAQKPVSIITELGQGEHGSDRVWLYWEDNVIENTWLQVIAPAFQGCDESDEFTFYFGNIIAETGEGDSGVDVFDLLRFRGDYRLPADITNVSDFDRSGHVNVFDLLIFRQHYRQKLVDLITPMPAN